jgi:cyclohexyl-isocyanide hydratase
MIPDHNHFQIGSLIFEDIDQIDVTGPFEVFSRLPNSTYRLYGTTTSPLRDMHGLRLMADALLSDAPQLDLLHVPGGPGQEALMENEAVLDWIRHILCELELVLVDRERPVELLEQWPRATTL